MFFGINEKCIILTHTMYCWLLQQKLLKTGFVLQAHIYTQITVLSESHIKSVLKCGLFQCETVAAVKLFLLLCSSAGESLPADQDSG